MTSATFGALAAAEGASGAAGTTAPADEQCDAASAAAFTCPPVSGRPTTDEHEDTTASRSPETQCLQRFEARAGGLGDDIAPHGTMLRCADARSYTPSVIALGLVILAACSSGSSGTAKAQSTTTKPAPATAPSRPDTQVWLCKPGQTPNPCLADLTTTVITAGGTKTVERSSPAADPKIDCFYVYPTVSQQKTANANLDDRGRGDERRDRPGVALLADVPCVRADVPPGDHRGAERQNRSAGPDRVPGRAGGVERLSRSLQRRPGCRPHRPLAGHVRPAPAHLAAHRRRRVGAQSHRLGDPARRQCPRAHRDERGRRLQEPPRVRAAHHRSVV